MLVGASSGDYHVSSLTASMRNAYRNQSPADATMKTQSDNVQQARNNRRADLQNHYANRDYNTQSGPIRPTFYTFKSGSSSANNTGAILDSDACASVVGKTTLDNALRNMELSYIPDGIPSRDSHRFGSHPDVHRTICAIKFPFQCSDENDSQISKFDIVFDVIDGELPFLVGLPSLMAMRSCLNFKFQSLGLAIGPKYLWIPLTYHDSHLTLPFSSMIRRSERDDSNPSNNGTDRPYSSLPARSHFQPPPEGKHARVTPLGIYRLI